MNTLVYLDYTANRSVDPLSLAVFSTDSDTRRLVDATIYAWLDATYDFTA